MSFLSLVPGLARPLLAVALATFSAGAVWQIQSWRYERQLAVQARLHLQTLNQLAQVSASAQQKQSEQHFALEQRLYSTEQAQQRVLNDAKQRQARLRDRLATAELRLSVLLDATDSARSNSLSATTASGRMVYGTQRAELDAAHAQRIISITGDGDQGLIALAACQGYVREIQKAAQ